MASGVPGCPDLSFRDLDLAFKCHEHSPRETGTVWLGARVATFRVNDPPLSSIETVVICGAQFYFRGEAIMCLAWRYPKGVNWTEPPPVRWNYDR